MKNSSNTSLSPDDNSRKRKSNVAKLRRLVAVERIRRARFRQRAAGLLDQLGDAAKGARLIDRWKFLDEGIPDWIEDSCQHAERTDIMGAAIAAELVAFLRGRR